MRIVFFGTSSFAANILEYLFQQQVDIVAVVTRPDRPFGRSQRIEPPPVKAAFEKLNSTVELLQPEKASTPGFAEILKSFAADLFVVVAYGRFLSRISSICPNLAPSISTLVFFPNTVGLPPCSAV